MKAWEKNVRTVVPYVPGEQPNQIGMIKLNTNENPYPPAPGVQEAIKSLDDKKMRLYPMTPYSLCYQAKNSPLTSLAVCKRSMMNPGNIVIS